MKKALAFIVFILFLAHGQNHPNSYSIEKIYDRWDGEYPLVFAVLGDNYSSTPIFRAFLEQFNSTADSLVFLLTTGDHAAGGDSAGYANYLSAIDPLEVPVVSTMGNHEINDSLGWDRFHTFFGSPDFYFDIGNARFIALTNCYPGPEPISYGENVYYKFLPEQLDWLDSLLSNWEGFKFVSIHAPPYLEGHWIFATVGGVGSAPGRIASLTDRFTDILRDRDVYICFCGHVHTYDRWTADNEQFGDVTYIVTGGGGISIMPVWPYDAPYGGGFYHYMVMELFEDGTMYGHIVRPDTFDDGVTTIEYDPDYEFVLEPPVGIRKVLDEFSLDASIAYPNPFISSIHISIPSETDNAVIMDICGRTIDRIHLAPGIREFVWKPETVQNGVYFVHYGKKTRKILYLGGTR